ncbi:hypothetical protein AB1N83_009384 [Pleurotus pulmonarius]
MSRIEAFGLRQTQVFDYLITYGDEVTLVWMRPKGIGSVLYLLARYPAFFDLTWSLYLDIMAQGMTSQRCTVLFKAQIFSFMTGISIAEAIMMMRVWAFWGGSRFMTTFLSSLWVASVVAVVAVLKQSLISAPNQDIVPRMPGCHSLDTTHGFIIFAVLMSLEAVILALTMIQCLRHSRVRVSHMIRPSSLYDLFIRDGVIYFVCLFAASLLNFLALHGDLPWQLNSTPIQRSLHAVLACRVFIHLRQHRSATRLDPNVGIPSLSEMHSSEVVTRPLVFNRSG